MTIPHTRMRTCGIAIVLLLAAGLGAAAAEELSGGRFQILKPTLASGSEDMAGASYELRSTLGQPEVGTMAGGTFSIRGGFWPAEEADDRLFSDSFEG